MLLTRSIFCARNTLVWEMLETWIYYRYREDHPGLRACGRPRLLGLGIIAGCGGQR
jgi:hypothetical protein